MPTKRLKPAETAETSPSVSWAGGNYSRSELRRKLSGRDFQPGRWTGSSPSSTPRPLKRWKLAQRLAGYYSGEKLWGPQKLLQKLVQRGIPVEMAREVMDREEESGRTPERLRPFCGIN